MSSSDLPVSSPDSSAVRTSEPCPHGLRPGTTVCLHCLREKRLAARGRRYRLAGRVALGTLAGVLLTALGVGAAKSMKPAARSVSDAKADVTVSTVQAGKPRASRATGARAAAASTTLAAPTIANGRTDLGDSVFVDRAGDSIVVHFDTETLRTRFDWKFESVVRSTLPRVYPQSQAALNAIPATSLVHGDLVQDITRQGVHLDLGTQGALMIWPITRPGQDGPLVVAYRVTASR